jgi:hypothetical protein
MFSNLSKLQTITLLHGKIFKKRGEMVAKVSINSIILQNFGISIENFTPYPNWVVDKEVITKTCFWFRVEAQ